MADPNRLRAALERAWATKFPEHPDSDELDDLMMELDELDGHIVGIGDTVLKGGQPSHAITGLEELGAAFASVQVQSAKDAQILEQCGEILAYLREIAEIVRAR